MNNVSLMGRLTKDPTVSYTQAENPMCIARFTLAVNRRVAKKDGEQQADFISCVAFGKSGELIEKYFKKGSQIGVTGRIQTGNYTNKDGQKVYTTDVVVEGIDFAGAKAEGGNAPAGDIPEEGFMPLAPGIDDEIPFS